MLRRPPREEDRPSAYDKALALLARREHSRRELLTKLTQRGYSLAEAEQALAALREERAQSDDRHAEALIRHRIAAGYGPRHLESELRSHGISPAGFQQELGAPDWAKIARDLVARRYGERIGEQATRARAAQFLQRRGFPSDVVAAVLRSARPSGRTDAAE